MSAGGSIVLLNHRHPPRFVIHMDYAGELHPGDELKIGAVLYKVVKRTMSVHTGAIQTRGWEILVEEIE